MKIRYAFLLTMMAATLWVYVKNTDKVDPSQIKMVGKPSATSAPAFATASNETKPEVLSRLHQEAAHIGQIDSAPENTEARLQSWAKTLTPNDLEHLEKTALDIQQPQDDRFLAVMLMAWSEKAQALENLKDIALAEIDPLLTPNRFGEFERILRMQAVDGLLDLPLQHQSLENTLQVIASKANESSIVDRAQRALWSLRGKADSPKAQDEKALKETLEKKGRR